MYSIMMFVLLLTGPSSVSPPQALYIYEDIPSSLAGIGPLIRIDPQVIN